MMGWIAVDLDATLAYYDVHRGEEIGEPIRPMLARVKRWLELGRDVRIFTARVAHDPNALQRRAIERWCEKYIGRKLPVTNCKDEDMDEIYDDRCVQVERNTGRLVGHSTRGLV